MKRGDLTNKKVVSALMIGISAMMALQTPITAYANEGVGEVPDNSGNEPETTQQVDAVEEYQEVTSDAQEQAEIAQDACVSDEQDAGAATESAPEDAGAQELGSASQEAAEAANLILEGDAEQGVAAADVSDDVNAAEEIEAVIDAASAVVQDSEEEDGSKVNAATTDLQNAADKIEDVKRDLAAAEDANKQFEKSYSEIEDEIKEASEDVSGINEQATNMTTVTEEAGQKAADLVESIQNAENKENAEKAYEDLEKLVSDTKADLEARKALYDRLNAEYIEAVKKLEEAQKALDEAEKKFDSKIGDATAKTEAAAADVTAAQQKVDNLADAIDVVEDKLEDEVAANNLSSTRGNDWDNKIGGVDKNRAVMKDVIVNYYMPEILGIEILADEVDYAKDFVAVKGVDGQEYNYHKFTYKYKDEEGNVQTGVKYFNWDSLLKLSPSTLNLNSADGMVVFEKSLEEIEANEYVIDYYKSKDASKLKDGNKWKAYLAGDFDVFTYTDEEGNKHYVIRDEINNPADGAAIEKDANGVPTSYNGHALKQVVQNKNNLLHDADCIIVGKDVKIDKYTQESNKTAVYKQVVKNLTPETIKTLVDRSKALNQFITDNSQDDTDATAALAQYAKYKEATAEAQKAVENASEQVDKLADAIDTVKTQSQNTRKSLKAVDVLGVSDIARYLGITVDETEAARLNDLTVDGLIKELDKLKKDADTKVKEAEEKAAAMEEKLSTAADDLKDTIKRLTPAAITIIEEALDSAGLDGSAGIRNEQADTSSVVDAGTSAVTAATAIQNIGGTDVSGAVALENMAMTETGSVAGAYEVQQAIESSGDNVVAGTVEDAVYISEESSPLAATAETISESQVKVGEERIVSIEDEDTALSVSADSDTIPQKMSWWWLLIIAVFGTTGEMMYKKHLKKKEIDDFKE